MNTAHSLCSRIAGGLALLVSLALLASCADSGYERVLASARTDCKGDEIVGVWSNVPPARRTVGVKASVFLFRPDGTGLCRTIYKNADTGNTTTPILWHYEGAGVWKSGTAGVGTSGTATIRFAGNALAWEEGSSLGVWAFRAVYIRMGNESLNGVLKPHP